MSFREPVEASKRPEGVVTTQSVESMAIRVASSSPECVFQSLVVLSLIPVKINFPSVEKARELMPTPYIEAAANYTRQAFELGARIACEVKGIAMPYHVYPKTKKPPLQAQDFLNKLKAWPGSDKVPKAGWDAALARLELLKNVVMNPYSHPSAPNIPKQEVQQAIEAVAHFLELVAKK